MTTYLLIYIQAPSFLSQILRKYVRVHCKHMTCYLILESTRNYDQCKKQVSFLVLMISTLLFFIDIK